MRSSKPPTFSRAPRRTSIPAVLTKNTSWIWSCWPWSISSSSIGDTARPVRSIEKPISESRSGLVQETSLGPRMEALGRDSASAMSRSSASGSGAQSSWSSHSQSIPEVRGSRRADITARPNCPLTAMTASSPRRERAQSALPSVEPVSTTRTSSIGRVWAARPRKVSRRNARPLWLTTIAMTLG